MKITKRIICLFTINLFIMTVSISCTKEERESQDVFITILNECRAQIKIYDVDETRCYLTDTYDCSYKSFLPLRLQKGSYKITAETFQGRKASKKFTKSNQSQSIIIEFP